MEGIVWYHSAIAYVHHLNTNADGMHKLCTSRSTTKKVPRMVLIHSYAQYDQRLQNSK